MTQSGYYEIHIEGSINCSWSDWFEGLTIRPGKENETILAGELADQAQLHGVLMRLRDLRLVLISVNRVPNPAATPLGFRPDLSE